MSTRPVLTLLLILLASMTAGCLSDVVGSSECHVVAKERSAPANTTVLNVTDEDLARHPEVSAAITEDRSAVVDCDRGRQVFEDLEGEGAEVEELESGVLRTWVGYQNTTHMVVLGMEV